MFWPTCLGFPFFQIFRCFSHQISGLQIFKNSGVFPEMSKIQLDCWMLYFAKVVILNGARDAFHRLIMCFGFLTSTIKIKFWEFVGYFTAWKSSRQKWRSWWILSPCFDPLPRGSSKNEFCPHVLTHLPRVSIFPNFPVFFASNLGFANFQKFRCFSGNE